MSNNLSKESIKYLDTLYMSLEYNYSGNKKLKTRKHILKLINSKLKKYNVDNKYNDNIKMLRKYKNK